MKRREPHFKPTEPTNQVPAEDDAKKEQKEDENQILSPEEKEFLIALLQTQDLELEKLIFELLILNARYLDDYVQTLNDMRNDARLQNRFKLPLSSEDANVVFEEFFTSTTPYSEDKIPLQNQVKALIQQRQESYTN